MLSVSDTDIYRAAHQLMKRYGAGAPDIAAHNADEAFAAGDKFNHDMWNRVFVAIRALKAAATQSAMVVH